MGDIILTKNQIESIVQLHEHFKHLQSFTLTILENGKASVNFEIADLKSIHKNQFVEKLV
jgi:hypothetical protein